MMGTSITNLSDSAIARILETENRLEVERLIPLIVYLALISVTGIIGNSLVCYIYYPSRCNASSSRWFIFFLGVVDLLLCVIVVPIEIVTTFQQFNFTNVIWCKVTAFLNLWTLLSLGLILVIVAIDRYRKVCTPHGWQLNTFKSKVMCGILVAVAFVIAAPSVYVYKIHTFYLSHSGIVGSECSFRTENNGLSLKFIYIGFGMLLFVCSLLTICILYCCIGVAIKRLITKERTNRYNSSSLPAKQTHLSSTDADDTSIATVAMETESNDNNDSVFTDNNIGVTTIERNKFKNKHTKSMRIKKARAKSKKATFSMFLISVAFVACYLPFLTLQLVRNLVADFQDNMSDEWRAVYKFFLRSGFLCCAINPFIYGLSDSKFRKSCNKVGRALKRILCCCYNCDTMTVENK